MSVIATKQNWFIRHIDYLKRSEEASEDVDILSYSVLRELNKLSDFNVIPDEINFDGIYRAVRRYFNKDNDIAVYSIKKNREEIGCVGYEKDTS